MATDTHEHDFVETLELAALKTAGGMAQKVKWPAYTNAALGVVILLAGLILGSPELQAAGFALLFGGGVTAGVGYQAPPPVVEHEAIPAEPLGPAPPNHD
jgi:hypothetical protein